MSDKSISTAPAVQTGNWYEPDAKLKRRYASDRRLRFYGVTAIVFALGMLAALVGTIAVTALPAITQTMVTLDVELPADKIDPADPRSAGYLKLFSDAVARLFPEVDTPKETRELRQLFTSSAQYQLRDMVVADPSLIGKTVAFTFPLSDIGDQLHKGAIDRNLPSDQRRVSDIQIGWYDRLVEQDRITAPFNWGMIFNADSRFPEQAGLWGALVGSFYALLICFLVSFPVGISAAVYLEEFAPKNRWTDIIEVNINNLAAVPSIVFGLLGLAVFLNFFGMPRSAPIVGGLVLSLMTLPTIIIATRAALKAVPPSIREAAIGVGASKMQTVGHHVLPLAMPGILTGTIIGLAQALGETAPLLLIGMNAFITAAPESMFNPSTALPTQIYIWADSPERGFTSRTSAAIIVLLGFLVCMNAIAIYMRKRFERKW
ncbi:phosphate ABC transporter permease PstA [Parvibaculum sp.]|uniref:phosphate ABC transporter permease PstA n=1 Tax=Parvibaculum sp. TaxID=2024848 RepID=UPI002730E80D|nr:phosphate ABC transporter permease PstA [Parvibaculum sp.]MDP1626430.1 phosphate ABC transporter permease PstA [Parvibaculum sp.]MDP2150352.1 phosphate ABC transporter permease PstA [Parvibaculum sp.]MDP3327894.1 phosphate ABC transporter permease PstA [Parvibaculum sp.]